MNIPWLEGHSDSGGECLNWVAKNWFDQERIRLSRSEPNRKNDNMYAEERNGHVGTVAEWQNRRFCHAEIRVILDKK